MTTGYRPEIIQSAFVTLISSRLSTFWSLSTPRLRLIARYKLSDELIALEFEANQAFRRQAFDLFEDWQGGQHISLSVPIEGIYHQRHYSLVGFYRQPMALQRAIDKPLISRTTDSLSRKRNTVTIAIKPQGIVSNYLTQQVALGAVFDSNIPTGDFTLDRSHSALSLQANSSVDSVDVPLLFIASGSGITPMLGLITQALQQNRQVTLLYYHRGASLSANSNTTTQPQAPFLAYWQYLAANHDSFMYHIIDTCDASSYLASTRYLTAEGLLSLSLPLSKTAIFACGSPSLLSGLYRAIEKIDEFNQEQLPNNDSSTGPSIDKLSSITRPLSLKHNVIVEHFGSATPSYDIDKSDTTTPQTIYLRSRQQQFVSDSTLLTSAEQSGIRLSYGCRQGICQLCRCQKISGVVKNIQTGKLSSNGFESIQTCITVAMSDVVLDI